MITDRERSLMLSAFKAGFYQDEVGSGEEDFNEWLNSEVSEGGLTVEMLIDHEAGK